jgi:hypothetical protein
MFTWCGVNFESCSRNRFNSWALTGFSGGLESGRRGIANTYYHVRPLFASFGAPNRSRRCAGPNTCRAARGFQGSSSNPFKFLKISDSAIRASRRESGVHRQDAVPERDTAVRKLLRIAIGRAHHLTLIFPPELPGHEFRRRVSVCVSSTAAENGNEEPLRLPKAESPCVPPPATSAAQGFQGSTESRY